MAIFTAQVVLAAKSGNTEDVNVTTLCAQKSTAPTEGELDDWQDAIKAFFDALAGSGRLRGRATAGHLTKFYATDTGVPNYPISERTWSLASPTSSVQMPPEVSLAISYANDSQTSIPRARRRGRIYISEFASADTTEGRPASGMPGAFVGAFHDYCDAVNATGTLTASIWSRSNAAAYVIERIWCDNEFDTMRSRGGKATSRVTEEVTVGP